MAIIVFAVDEDFFSLLDKLRDLDILSNSAEMQLMNALARMEEAFEEGKRKKPASGDARSGSIGIVSNLAILNLFGAKGSRCTYGKRSAEDKRMLALAVELNERAQAQCLCMVHEEFERFLKEFASALFFAMRDQEALKLKDRQQFDKKHPELRNIRNTGDYFRVYVKSIASRDCDELLRELAANVSRFEQMCERNWRGIDLLEFYRALEFIRHRTVHCGGEVTLQALKKCSAWARGFITRFTGTGVLSGRQTILPSAADVGVFLESIAGVAYVLYRTASEQLKMKVAPIK